MNIRLKKQVEALVAKLKPQDRVELADKLYARSLPRAYLESVNRAWDQEIDRRLDEYEKGNAVLIPSKEAHARLRKVISEARRAHTFD
jgi:putative addiction module component (TIGR02574 family)